MTKGTMEHLKHLKLDLDKTTLIHGTKLQPTFLLVALATATTIQERQGALDLLLLALDRDDIQGRKDLCFADGMILLFRCLQKEFLRWNSSKDYSDGTVELIDSMLKLLDLLFRFSSEYGSSAFHTIGADLVSILVSYVHSQDGVMSSSIFLLVDSLADLKQISLPVTQKSTLLIGLLQKLIRDEYKAPSFLFIGCRLISGLSKQADNAVYIGRHPGLIEDVVTLLCHPTERVELKYYISEFFLQLARDWSTKFELLNKRGFLDVVLKLLRLIDDSTTLRSNTVLIAIQIIWHLASEANCRIRICSFCKGSFLKALIVAMKSPALKTKVSETIVKLIDYNTAPGIIKQNPLLVLDSTRSLHLMTETFNKDGPNDQKKRKQSHNYNQSINRVNIPVGIDETIVLATLVIRLARYLTVQDKSHPLLIDALIKLASLPDSKCRTLAAKGIREQTRTAAGRFYMIRAHYVLDVLIDLANDTCRSVQATAMEALFWLTSDPLNVRRLVLRGDILTMLVNNGKQLCDSVNVCRSAIRAMISLAGYEFAQFSVAKTIDLVEVLSTYGISDDADIDLRTASLQCVIALAPLM